MNTAEIIAKYGLSVRYVPLTSLKTSYLESQTVHKVRWSNRHRAVKVLKDGGYWLCKRLNERSGSVFWNSTTDNRAKTLDESVVLFMNGISDFIHSLFGCLSERNVFTVEFSNSHRLMLFNSVGFVGYVELDGCTVVIFRCCDNSVRYFELSEFDVDVVFDVLGY